MDKGFRFIDGTVTDRSTRRFARSHAMKGKNVGKTHPHRSRLDRSQAQNCRKPTVLQSSYDERDEEKTERPARGLLGWSEQLAVCRSPPLPFLLETTPQSLDVIKNYFTFVVEAVYPSRLCLPLDRIKSYWIRMMFLDSTSYHCSLALMATLNGFVFANEAMPVEAMHHLGKAVGLVNQKLGTAEGLSNSCISVVNFLVIRDMFKNEQQNAEVHLNGLRKMITLRGGLAQLEEDRTLVLKICKTDIDYALHYGAPTGFYRDRFAEAAHVLALKEPVNDNNSAFAGPELDGINPFLRQILRDTNSIAYWFNEDGKGRKADADALQEVIVSVGYRLVQFHALSGPQLESTLEAAYHIGLIAFMTTLFLQVRGRRFLRYSLVASCLKNTIDRQLQEENSEAMLWVLFVGGISVLAEEDPSWLELRILRVSRSIGVESWVQLRQLLIQFPWICSIHDEPGKALWEAVKTIAIDHNSSGT